MQRATPTSPFDNTQKVQESHLPGWSFPRPLQLPRAGLAAHSRHVSHGRGRNAKPWGVHGDQHQISSKKGQRGDVSGNIFLTCTQMKRKRPRGNTWGKKKKKRPPDNKIPALLSSFTFPRTLAPSCPQPRGKRTSEGARSLPAHPTNRKHWLYEDEGCVRRRRGRTRDMLGPCDIHLDHQPT